MDKDQQGLYDVQKATDGAWQLHVNAFQTKISLLQEEHKSQSDAYKAKITLLRQQHEKINSGYEELTKQQQKQQMTNEDEKNTSHNVSDDDILEINVSGKIISVQRGVLTQIKGSRLETLFCGRWDKKLRQQKDGLMFLDVNHDAFQAIVEYLKNIKTVSPNNDPPKYRISVNENNRVFLERLCHLFGLRNLCLCHRPTIDDSTILNNLKEMHTASLLRFLEEDNVHGNLKLIYKASRDGWRTGDFHSKCDNKGPTVTLIQSTNGYVFGGFADTPWTSSGGWKASETAFLFALKCHSGLEPTKMKQKIGENQQYTVHHNSECGPTFGRGYDIYVSDNANFNNNSRTNVGGTYECPSGQTRDKFLTGSRCFQAAEIEVFSVVPLMNADWNLRKDVVNNDIHSSKSEPWQTMKFEEFPQDLKETMYTEQKELIASWDKLLASETKLQEDMAFVNFVTAGDVNIDIGGKPDRSEKRMQDTAEHVRESLNSGAKQEQEIDNRLVCDWTCEEVAKWAKNVRGLSEEVSEIFEEHQITGAELLALEQEHLKDLGITRLGTLAVAFKAIQSLQQE